MAGAASHFLVTCHASILQRIIDLADASDLFLLRQVARRWRFAADGRIRRMRPGTLDDRSPPVAGLMERFPGLTSLDLELCDFEPVLLLPEMLSTPATRLRELSLNRFDTALPDEWLAQQLPGLTRLAAIYPNNVPDATIVLRMAARCRSLRRLQLVQVDLQWAPLQAALAQLAPSLTDLDITISSITGDLPPNGLQALNTGRLQALHLWLDFLDLPDLQAAFSDLAAFTSLRLLDLGGSGMTPAQLEQLNSLTRLTRLDLHDSDLSSAALAELTRLTQLAALRLDQQMHEAQEGAVFELIDVEEALAGFPRLTDLSLGIEEEVIGYECLSSLTGLTKLDGTYEVLEEPDVLPRLTRLQELYLWGVHDEEQLRQLSDAPRSLARGKRGTGQRCPCLPSAGAAGVLKHAVPAGLTRLTSLRLQGRHGEEPLSPRLDWLPALQALQELHLNQFSLHGSMLPALAALPVLRKLGIYCEGLHLGCDLRPLEQLPALQRLHLPQTFERPEQLPARLRVPFIKGRRGDWSLDD